MKRSLMVAGIVAASVLLLGCGDDGTSTDAGSSASGSDIATDAESAVPADAVIIDVRSAEEFAAGHLEGALNYNVEDGTLAEQLSSLDPNGNYIVYCRSGRRSAVAADMMRAAGFESVTDLGALETAADSTGRPVVVG